MSEPISDQCPFCDSAVHLLSDGKPCRAADGAWVAFECLTSIHRGHDPRAFQSGPCEAAERSRLAAELDTLRRDAWVGAACLHLLAEHGVPIGSPELLAAKDRVEAEMQTLRTANAGLVEKLKELEEENRSVYNLMVSGERRGIEKATQELQPQLHALKASLAEIEQLRDHVKRLVLAGDVLDWLASLNNSGATAREEWSKAKGQP